MKFLKQRFDSFGYALEGLVRALKSETNLKLQLLAGTVAVSAGVFFEIQRLEMALVLLCVGGVIGLELVNTALEQLCNKLSPEQSPEVKYIKDVAAASVLVASVVAFACGLIIFWPYIFGLN